MYFTDNDDYHKFLVFVPVLNSLTMDNNKIFLTGYPPEYHLKKMYPLDTNFEQAMSNSVNGRAILKFNYFWILK